MKCNEAFGRAADYQLLANMICPSFLNFLAINLNKMLNSVQLLGAKLKFIKVYEHWNR